MVAAALLMAGACLFVSGTPGAHAQAAPPTASEPTTPIIQQPAVAQDATAGQIRAPQTHGDASLSLPGEETQARDDATMAIDIEGAAAAAPEPVAIPEPAPSFFADPAGAISHLMTPAERDPGLPHDLSPWGMFMMADWVVKAVMILLVLASFGVWTVWLAKTIEIACARARARRAVDAIGHAATLAAAGRALSARGGPAAFMVRSAENEMSRSAIALDHAGNDGVKERLGARLARIEAQAGRRLSRGTGFLAIVGSTAPFIGLFGTVWGIMNAFIGISEAQTTNLAVVAPGIAEALLATAIGLVAAIPAVIIYNLFARSITGYGQLLADAASGVEQLVSLDLDLRKVPANDPGSPTKAALPGSPAATIAAE